MGTNKRECCRCCHFDAYFTKAYCSFLRTDCGNCRKKRAIVKKHDGCPEWRAKTYYLRLKQSAVLQELGEIVTKINMLKTFVEAEEEKPKE